MPRQPHAHPDPLGRSALLTIDMQRDFADPAGTSFVAGTDEVVANINRLVTAFRSSNRPVIHVVRLYAADGSDAEPVRATAIAGGLSVVQPGSVGSQLVLDVPGGQGLDATVLRRGEAQQLGPNEWAIYKPRWGAFFRTPLELFLRTRDVQTVAIAGCNWPNCPRATLYEASERDFVTVLATDAVSGLYDRGTREAAGIGTITVDTTALVGAMAGRDRST